MLRTWQDRHSSHPDIKGGVPRIRVHLLFSDATGRRVCGYLGIEVLVQPKPTLPS